MPGFALYGRSAKTINSIHAGHCQNVALSVALGIDDRSEGISAPLVD
jgi:hypothetical protein